jgi:hypothetical protein
MANIILASLVEISDSMDWYRKQYGVDTYKVIDSVYDFLVKNNRFMSQVTEPSNSEDDIKEMYLNLVDQALVDSIDLSLGDNCLIAWNLLTSDSYLHCKWIEEMYGKIKEFAKSSEKS